MIQKVFCSKSVLIAKSACILEILDVIEKASKSESSILITGESGVGKEIFAEEVHKRSLRRNEPFVKVNCAAINESLIESELFGHVKGAFTDAINNRTGRFEAADKGSIFLDEIGDLPLSLQAKILRVIQEKKFEKVGSGDSIEVDVRIIAATNKDIEEQVRTGQFREDLFYRLNVLPIYIPPLRQRQQDIMELAYYFLEMNKRKQNKDFNGFSDNAIQLLLSYSWPGNVRELQNCIERACVIGKKQVIDTDDLQMNQKVVSVNGRNLKAAVNAFKANFIKNVLKECNWNKTEAAKVLAIERTYLSKLIKELEIKDH